MTNLPDRVLERSTTEWRLSRRDLVIWGGRAAGAAALAPLVAACGGEDDGGGGGEAGGTATIRHLGYGVDQLPAIQAAAKKAGFDVVFTTKDLPTVGQLAVTNPGGFDVLSPDQHQVPQILPAGTIQPIDTGRINDWDKIVDLFKTGRQSAECTYGAGDAAYRMMYLDPDDPSRLTAGDPFEAAETDEIPESDVVFGVPNVYNVDSLGYNREVFGRDVTSWAELVNPEWQGRVAIINDPASGPQSLALALQAAGRFSVQNLGNMTKEEIDALTKLVIDMKNQGHFRAFWTTFEESVTLMASGEVVVENMWQPAQTALLQQGHDVGYAAPDEGYLGWCIFLSIPEGVEGEKLDAVYDFINWWVGGEPGAIVARQGYYSPVPENVKKFLEPEEWDYWYDGKPAAKELPGPDGNPLIPKGTVREGGSFEERVCKYAFWQTTMPENQYMTQRWNDFVSA
jgi:putative spermidine/putrescine transport system substrate-binding protein